jgi:hypothetical protein
MDPFMFWAALGLAIYGTWAVRRDRQGGRASARGFGFSRQTQPRRYWALMSFNMGAVVLLWVSVAVMTVQIVWHQISN